MKTDELIDCMKLTHYVPLFMWFHSLIINNDGL